MKTIVYLIRHSEPMKKMLIYNNDKDVLFMRNMKLPLSIDGEKYAEQLSENKEFNNIGCVWSSNYVRALSTAKYFAIKNKLPINIDERLNERIYGVESWDQLEPDFELKQVKEKNYKMPNGESRREVQERMTNVFDEILNNNLGKKIIIVGHSTSIFFLLMKWCQIDDGNTLTFHNEIIFNGKWNYCERFKLEFDNKKSIISIKT